MSDHGFEEFDAEAAAEKLEDFLSDEDYFGIDSAMITAVNSALDDIFERFDPDDPATQLAQTKRLEMWCLLQAADRVD